MQLLISIMAALTLSSGAKEVAGAVDKATDFLSDRNARALEVLETEIKASHENLDIFYGAAHFPDMEKPFVKKGYKKNKQDWLTAWSVA